MERALETLYSPFSPYIFFIVQIYIAAVGTYHTSLRFASHRNVGCTFQRAVDNGLFHWYELFTELHSV